MILIIVLISSATFALVLAVAMRLRRWMQSARREINALQNEIRAITEANKTTGASLTAAISNMTAESVNSSCINALGFRFPVFMGGPSIDTHHARSLLFLLQEKKPRAILELGSGSSTIIIARALKLMSASPEIHISVDHEERFLNNTRELARLNGVDELVQFECCPLVALDGFPSPWYSRLPELLGAVKFDFVLVDGPPAYAEGQGRTREPALSVLKPYLAPKAVIFLDDANRPGELDVAQAWREKYPEFDLYHVKDGKGVAIFTSND